MRSEFICRTFSHPADVCIFLVIFQAGIDYLNRQGFPLQTSSHGVRNESYGPPLLVLISVLQILDILVGDNDEPVIGVNPDVATLGAPSNDRDQGWAAFSSLCREVSLIFIMWLWPSG